MTGLILTLLAINTATAITLLGIAIARNINRAVNKEVEG